MAEEPAAGHAGAHAAGWAGWNPWSAEPIAREGRIFFFEKKETKNFCSFIIALREGPIPEFIKVFWFFFQKRTYFFFALADLRRTAAPARWTSTVGELPNIVPNWNFTMRAAASCSARTWCRRCARQ
jgi:hypothetical protein